MLSDDEIEAMAQEHVRKNYPADCEILHRERRLEPDGIYFGANRRDPHDFYVGGGGFFVARMSGEIWEFGSGQIGDLDYWLKWHAEGWRPGKYRLIVRQLKFPRRLAHLLACTFMVSADLLLAILPMVEAKELATVEYSHIGEPQYDWRPENNMPEQLGPQWDWSSPSGK